MKNLILTLLALHYSLFTSLFASPFEPRPAVECVVYSAKADSPLHVATVPAGAAEVATRWDFPPSYTGHRSVCVLQDAPTNAPLVAWTGGDRFTPGDPTGTTAGRRHQAVDISPVSPVCNRISLWNGSADRSDDWSGALAARCLSLPSVVAWIGGDEAKRAWYADFLARRASPVSPPAAGMPVRVRVVRYAVDDRYCYDVGVYGDQYEQRVLLDRTFDPSGRDFLCEADFLADGEFDIDWTYLRNEVVNASGVAQASLAVSNMTYLVVIGDGPTSFRGPFGTNTTVNALATMVTRRFEVSCHAPVAENVEASASGVPPTFRWSVPGEDAWAKAYGSSYTAFKLQVVNASTNVLYDSGVLRAPARDCDGRFSWAADDLPAAASSGNLKWRVAMYNAKFKPISTRLDLWSNLADLTIDAAQDP